MSSYPEIAKLQQLFEENEITVEILERADKDYTHWVQLSVNKKEWKLYVDDEFGDLNEKKPVLALFVILSTLLDYSDTEDYLEWCKTSSIEPNDGWLNYYRSLASTTKEIEAELGSLDPIITPYDYTMGTGVAQALRAL